MKIASIELSREKIELKKPFVTALRELSFAEFIRVYVLCDDGNFAYGEAPATEAITGESLESIERGIEDIKEIFYKRDIDEVLELLHRQTIGSSAKAALDIAFVGLLAKQRGLSLMEYFGIKDTKAIKTDITISLGSKSKMLQESKNALREGMNILKVKLGADIAHAIETTKLLNKQLSHAELLIDANQAWSLEDTLLYLKSTQECRLELLEQPVAAKDVEALTQIREQSHIAILADEAVFTLEDMKRVLFMGAADMINIKVMKCGGVSRAVEMLEYAREKGVKCMLGSMIEGPYSINMTLYLAFAYRDVVAFVDLDSPLLYKELPDEMDFCYAGAIISFKECQPVLQ
jgi:L-alanine-DL-glutamate epimerase-like enolase superfamily enzyme